MAKGKKGKKNSRNKARKEAYSKFSTAKRPELTSSSSDISDTLKLVSKVSKKGKGNNDNLNFDATFQFESYELFHTYSFMVTSVTSEGAYAIDKFSKKPIKLTGHDSFVVGGTYEAKYLGFSEGCQTASYVKTLNEPKLKSSDLTIDNTLDDDSFPNLDDDSNSYNLRYKNKKAKLKLKSESKNSQKSDIEQMFNSEFVLDDLLKNRGCYAHSGETGLNLMLYSKDSSKLDTIVDVIQRVYEAQPSYYKKSSDGLFRILHFELNDFEFNPDFMDMVESRFIYSDPLSVITYNDFSEKSNDIILALDSLSVKTFKKN